MLCLQFIGDGLRDAFDPRQKRIPKRKDLEVDEQHDPWRGCRHEHGPPVDVGFGPAARAQSDRSGTGSGRRRRRPRAPRHRRPAWSTCHVHRRPVRAPAGGRRGSRRRAARSQLAAIISGGVGRTARRQVAGPDAAERRRAGRQVQRGRGGVARLGGFSAPGAAGAAHAVNRPYAVIERQRVLRVDGLDRRPRAGRSCGSRSRAARRRRRPPTSGRQNTAQHAPAEQQQPRRHVERRRPAAADQPAPTVATAHRAPTTMLSTRPNVGRNTWRTGHRASPARSGARPVAPRPLTVPSGRKDAHRPMNSAAPPRARTHSRPVGAHLTSTSGSTAPGTRP